MVELPDFQKKQYAFAAHIRDPEHNPGPDDVEDRRMAIYRELFFNNLHSLLSQTFPVLKKLHDAEKWRALVRQFMISHQAQTPYFLGLVRLPRGFHDLMVDARALSPLLVWTGLFSVLFYGRGRESAPGHGRQAESADRLR